MRSVIALLAALIASSRRHPHTRKHRHRPRPARSSSPIVDSTGAVLPGATVTVTGIEAANKAATIEPAKAAADGVATIQKLAPGRYSVQAEFAGFETRMLPDVRVRNGNNKQVLMLPIEGHKETVLVGQDKQAAAADPRGPSFGTTLTREQLDALSDDPEVLRQQLQDMAGPGAVIKIDSFEGGALPPKAQIRSIRISRDQFAAEYHNAGGVSIEIITQPGLGPLRMNVGYRFRGDNLTGTSPVHAGARAGTVPHAVPRRRRHADQEQELVQPVLQRRRLGTRRRTSTWRWPTADAAPRRLRLRSPRDNFNVNANVDYALTLNQTLRFGLFMFRNNNRNLGIGQWDEETRAYDSESTNGQFRAQQIGPLGRRGVPAHAPAVRLDRLGLNVSRSRCRPSA